MVKAVFTVRLDSGYDDLPESRYHFPLTYLKSVQSALDDFIVYYAPRRGGGPTAQRYFAVARVAEIVPDPKMQDHHYALMRDYLAFPNPVPVREAFGSYETGLTKADGSANRGLFGRSVRKLDEDAFTAILAAGFAEEPARPQLPLPGLAEDDQAPFPISPRPAVEILLSRPQRDRAFARLVQDAYDKTCAVTGLRLINGGGRAEVQACHIRPVAADGPDSLRNGLALSGTVHWLFDRGKISISDEGSLLRAPGIPAALTSLFPPDDRLRLPERPDQRPHPQFLKFHREHIFTGPPR